MDTQSIREKTLEAYRQGPEAVVELVVQLVTAFSVQMEALAARVAALETENAALRARLATNSRNSSKPPSSDGPGMKPHPKSQRKASGRKPGGQQGHVGRTLLAVDEPDEVRVHVPDQCRCCGQKLNEVAPVREERRQVHDLPPVKVRVVEHRAETKCCPGCGMETSGTFPEDVLAAVQYGPAVQAVAVYLNQGQLLPLERTCEVIADLFGCPIAEGTLASAVGKTHEQLGQTEATIKEAIEGAGVAHFDETGLNVGGKTSWLHVASTPKLTFYAVDEKRGREAMDRIGVLAKFLGRAIHDGLPSYWQYEQCDHGLCNGHHLRELTFVEEQLGQPWAKDLKGLLLEIKQAVDEARGRGVAELPAEMRQDFGVRYETILAAGAKANPPPEPTGKAGRPKRGKAGNLVDRLTVHKEATLAFMEDLAVPFDNNQAERDIRMMKVRQKISGCFRTTTGAKHFCRIRGYISTLRKQGLPVLSALRNAIVGTPHTPALA